MSHRLPIIAGLTVLSLFGSAAAREPSDAAPPLGPLRLAIAAWVARDTGLPVPAEMPAIVFVETPAMPELMGRPSRQSGAGDAAGVVAFYDSSRHMIYLPAGWSGATPAELSILVHEMVHHAQTAAGQRFACGGERERAAYLAQSRWLALFGTDLEREFGLDKMFLLVATSCGMP